MKPDDAMNQQLDIAFKPSTGGDRSHCPSEETIWAAVAGQLRAEQVAPLLDHASGCSECVEAWKLARELSTETLAKPARSFPLAAGMGLLAAAAMLVFFLFSVPRRGPQPVQAPGFRGTSTEKIVSSIEGKTLPHDAFLLQWTPGPEGSIYRLELSTAADPLPSPVPTLDTSFHVPADWLKEVESGSSIYWRVRMSSPGGAESASVTFANLME